MWKTSDGGELRRFLPPDDKPGLNSERALLSPDGISLAVYFKGENPAVDIIRIWNLSNQKQMHLASHIYSDWEFSTDSKLLAVTAITRKGQADERSAVEIWDVNNGQHIRTIEVPKDWRGGFAVAFSPDSTMIAIGGYKKFGIFTTQTGVLLVESQHTRSGFFEDSQMVNELSDLEFSPDGKLLLTSGNEGSVMLWRLLN